MHKLYFYVGVVKEKNLLFGYQTDKTAHQLRFLLKETPELFL